VAFVSADAAGVTACSLVAAGALHEVVNRPQPPAASIAAMQRITKTWLFSPSRRMNENLSSPARHPRRTIVHRVILSWTRNNEKSRRRRGILGIRPAVISRGAVAQAGSSEQGRNPHNLWRAISPCIVKRYVVLARHEATDAARTRLPNPVFCAILPLSYCEARTSWPGGGCLMGAARRVRFTSPDGFCSRFAHTVPVDRRFPSAGPCIACLAAI
jgi:hypothetical protein